MVSPGLSGIHLRLGAPLVLTVGLALTLLAWQQNETRVQQQQQMEFEAAALEAVSAIERRLQRHVELLYGITVALGRAAPTSPQDFEGFVHLLGLSARYPGVVELVYAKRENPAATARKSGQIAPSIASNAKSGGLQPVNTYRIEQAWRAYGAGKRADGNFFSDDTDRTTIERALGMNEPVVAPAQLGRNLAIFLPILADEAASFTAVGELREAPALAMIALRLEAVLAGMIDEMGTLPHMKLRIHDAGTSFGAPSDVTDANLLFGPKEISDENAFIQSLTIAGRTWTITITPLPAGVTASDPISLIIVFGGGAISVLLSLLLFSLSRARTSAVKIAESATRELREQLHFTRQLVEAIPNPVYFKDALGRYTGCNIAFEEVAALPRSQLIGRTAADILAPNSAATHDEADRELVAAAGQSTYEASYCTKDGEERTVIVNKATFFEREGDVAGIVGTMVDISGRKAAERALIRSEAQTRLALEAAGMAVWDWDITKSRFTHSERLGELYGIERGFWYPDLAGFLASVHPDDRMQVDEAILLGIKRNNDFQFEFRVVWPDQSVHWLTTKGQTTRNESGNAERMIGVVADVTEKKRAEERITFLAYHDALTALPNRQLLCDRIGQAIVLAACDDAEVAVLFADLDRFKTVNDSLGHDYGDRLLQAAASRLRTCIREVDTVARLGGDEFVVLLPMLSRAEALETVVRIQEALAMPFRLDDRSLAVSASIGGCAFPRDGADADTLLRKADTAMYHAKNQGRATFVWFDEAMSIAVNLRFQMEIELREALDLGQLRLHYQPIFALPGNELSGFEALIRWQHPTRGLVMPGEFISMAEEAGLLGQIGEWVFAEACRYTRHLQDKGLRLRVAVNVSASQLKRPLFHERLAAMLDVSGADPKLLTLELTENVLLDGSDESVNLLARVAAMGIHISVDDFGTGYSGFSYLARFPIHAVKIDQSFIRRVTERGEDAAIVGAIIAMAKALKLTVVAEGVETVEQLEFLRAFSCDMVQGFYLGRPLEAAALEDLIEREAHDSHSDERAPLNSSSD